MDVGYARASSVSIASDLPDPFAIVEAQGALEYGAPKLGDMAGCSRLIPTLLPAETGPIENAGAIFAAAASCVDMETL